MSDLSLLQMDVVHCLLLCGVMNCGEEWITEKNDCGEEVEWSGGRWVL
ncbi:hypothetical protein M758_5G158300 [Ceratodon purpureus]|nr:hypothetical protein M758_5G158300 [Ceratodon purpureus]